MDCYSFSTNLTHNIQVDLESLLDKMYES